MNEARRRRELIRERAENAAMKRHREEPLEPIKPTTHLCCNVILKNNFGFRLGEVDARGGNEVHMHISKSHPFEDIEKMQKNGFVGEMKTAWGYTLSLIMPGEIQAVQILGEDESN
jgi:hypothetical protein